jgi:hypothetical protein
MYPATLREYILALHGVDIVWLPTTSGEEPPF